MHDLNSMHEPLVALTDLALFLIALYCAWRLPRGEGGFVKQFRYQFIFLGTAALFGALFHAFFPLKDATLSGLIVWLLVCGSIGGTAYTMVLVMTESLVTQRRKLLRNIFLALLAFFLVVIAFYKRTYDVVLTFYAPVLLLYFVYACVHALHNRGWKIVAFGLFLSIGAGVLQGSGIAIGVLDHNTLYHIVQAAALFVLLRGYQSLSKT